jgi:hypothetical protein
MRMTYLPKVAKTNPNRLARLGTRRAGHGNEAFVLAPSGRGSAATTHRRVEDSSPDVLRALILPFHGREKLIQSTDTPLALIGAAHFSISLLTKCFR